jgi:hypothetical protein
MSFPDATTKALDETFRKYVWDYFALHADHRLRAFHFYILLCTALIGGLAVSAKDGNVKPWMSVFGLLLIFFSFVFWKMDTRTRQLVKNAENALKHLDAHHGLPDQDELPHALRLFAREEELSRVLPLLPLFSGHFSYARCFRWVFGMFSLVGLVVSIGAPLVRT